MKRVVWCVAVLVVASVSARADLLSATQAFLDSLNDEQRADALRPFDAERENWHFIPKDREGPSFKTLNDEQDALLLGVLQAGLSEEGYTKAEAIRHLEPILRIMEGADFRDLERYHLLIFGEPKEGGTYTVRYEGHHLSLHWTVVDGKLASGAPQFLGTNPAEVRIDHPQKGLRVLKDEEDLARKLVTSLSEEQAKVAIIGTKVPGDIFTANQPKAERQDDLGIRYGDLNPEQQTTMLSLIEVVARVQSEEITQKRMGKVHADLENVKFAWLGSVEPGEAHYYRIQGAEFLIEYVKIQNQANHIHIVWRDFDGDFGRDLLGEHHAAHEHHQH